MKKTALLAVALTSAGLGLASAAPVLAYSPCGRAAFGPTCVGQVYVAPTPSSGTQFGTAPYSTPAPAGAPAAPSTRAVVPPAAQPTFTEGPVSLAPMAPVGAVEAAVATAPAPELAIMADPIYLTPKTGAF